MYGNTVTFGQAAIICVFSIAVVFLVLLAISYMIDVVAWIVNKDRKKSVAAKKQEVSDTPASEPVLQDYDLAEVAAITAAVAAYLGEDSSAFVVRSIRKIGTEETAWSRAGRLDSLQ